MQESTLKKILICSYVIIVLLILNTIILICKGNVTTPDLNDSKTTNNQTTDNQTNTEYDVSMMESVDLTTMLNDVFKRKDIQVVYMGRATCGHCISFLPSLQKAQEELGYKTVYLDIETVDTSSSEYEKFIKKLDKEYTMNDQTGTYGSFYGYTPAVFLYKNGKMIDGQIGAMEYNDLISWLRKNGVNKDK